MAEGEKVSQSIIRQYEVPIFLVLLGILLVAFVGVPNWNNVQELQSQITSEQARLDLLKEKNLKLLNFADQGSLLDEQFALFDKAIPTESQVPELLNQIQKISDSCGVEVTGMQFGGEVTQAGALRQVRLQYSAKSKFKQLTCFVVALEGASRLVGLESIRYGTSGGFLFPEAILLSYYTPEPTLLPDTPLTFSLSDPSYTGAVTLLETLKTY